MMQSTEHQGRNQAHTYFCRGPTEATGAVVTVIPSSTNIPLGNTLVPSSVALTTVPSIHTKPVWCFNSSHTLNARSSPRGHCCKCRHSKVWCVVYYARACVFLSPCISCWQTDDGTATCVYFCVLKRDQMWQEARGAYACAHGRMRCIFCCLPACWLRLSSFDVNAQRQIDLWHREREKGKTASPLPLPTTPPCRPRLGPGCWYTALNEAWSQNTQMCSLCKSALVPKETASGGRV